MRKTLIIIIISVLLNSCGNNAQIEELNKKNIELRNIIDELEEEVLKLEQEKDQIRLEVLPRPNIKISELKDSRVLEKIITKPFKDTLDLAKYGNGYVFERNVEYTKLDNDLFAVAFANIREKLTFYGYSVFSICDGEPLPLEMCNCTDSIYIVVEPEELGEDYELYRIGFFYNVKLLTLEKFNNTVILEFKHGKYPRKNEKIDLMNRKF